MSRDKYSDPQYDPSISGSAFYASTGLNSLKLDGECLYAMPEFLVPNLSLQDVRMEFSVNHYSANCLLQVGVLTDVNNPSSFVALETFSNGTTGPCRHVVDFGSYDNMPQNATFIAFRNVYNGNWGRSIVFIDDITLSLATTTSDPVAVTPQTEGDNNESDEEYVDDDANTDFEEVMSPIGISDFDLSDLTVYPNPTTGLLTIVADEVNRVEVYNQIGVMVAAYTEERVIDLTNLSSGVYVLRVTTPQGVAIRKVVKK